MPPTEWQFSQSRYDLSDFRRKTLRPPLSVLPEALSQGEKSPDDAKIKKMSYSQV
jgi:hypothetical protein